MLCFFEELAKEINWNVVTTIMTGNHFGGDVSAVQSLGVHRS